MIKDNLLINTLDIDHMKNHPGHSIKKYFLHQEKEKGDPEKEGQDLKKEGDQDPKKRDLDLEKKEHMDPETREVTIIVRKNVGG